MTLSFPYRRAEWSIAVLAFVHAVGLVGMATPARDWFVALTPVTLLLSLGLLLAHHRAWNGAFAATALTIAVAGFGLEVAGVHSGLIFGEYTYGATLGWKLWEVPPVIGLNWLILVYCTGVIAMRLPGPGWMRALAGAGLMTGLDAVMEPVAIRFGFWTWADGTPPLQNYLAWLGAAFILQLGFHYLPFQKQNKVAPALYLIQFLFFAVLNFYP